MTSGSNPSTPFCPACYSRDQVRVHYEGDVHKLFECPDCQLQHFWPRLNPGAEWYEQNEMYEGRDSVVDWLAWYHREGLARLPVRTGKLIDIGCGNGTFVAEADRVGFEAMGIDFSTTAIEMGRRHFGLTDLYDVRVEDLPSRFPGRLFDVVTAFEVLEHMEDVGQFLRAIERVLAPGGHLVVSVPHRDRRPFLTEGDHPPHHFTRWSRLAMANVLARHGFAIRSITVSPPAESVRHWLLVNLRLRLVLRLLRRARAADAQDQRNDLARARSLIMLKDRFATAVGTLAGPMLGSFVQGHMMVTVASKPGPRAET